MNNVSANSSKDDWLNFSFSVLVEKGPDALKIISLCELKGVSKGSFYHHFKNRAEFIEQLMQYWFEKMTVEFIEQANTESSPLERLQKLDTIIAGHNLLTELHIRAWALKEPKIKEHLGVIDTQRQQYLSQCYVELGIEKALADDIAVMAYSSFLGMQQIYPALPIETVLRVTTLGSKKFIEEHL
jgi:AcrR family transcriptional regulator